MPISKQDVMSFGATLKDTLTTWGEQIQYGRDIAKLEKVQNQLSNVKNFTTDKDGNPLDYETITQKIMGITNQLTDIRTPEVMRLAQTNVGEFIKTNFAGAMQHAQNQFDMGMDNITNPADADKVQALTNSMPSGMFKFKAGTLDKTYAAKIVNELIYDKDGKIDPNAMNQYALMTTSRGGLQKVFIGKVTKDKMSVNDLFEMERLKTEGDIKVASTPRHSSSYSSGPNQYKMARINGQTYPYNERNATIKVNGKWVDPSTVGVIDSFVGSSGDGQQSDNAYEETADFLKKKNAAEKLISSFYTGKGESEEAINAIVEAAKKGQLWETPYWYNLDQATKDMIQNLLFPNYMQQDPNREGEDYSNWQRGNERDR